MGQEHAGFENNIHGGVILRLIDEAAGLCAIRYAGGRVVTAAIDAMSFLAPVYVGQLLSLSAGINQVWHSSMEVEVEAKVENIISGDSDIVAHAYLTMVALDSEGHPALLEPLALQSDDQKRRAQEADDRRQARLAIR